jgi:serine/threonine-protein kinase
MLPNEETVVAARPDPYVGKVIDKYKLVERLGAGGMGLVYRAEQARMDRCVAIKLLPFTLVNDEVNVKRIEREAKAMGNLRHPNIATIFDFGFSAEYQPYLVMELIAGQSLGSLIHQSRSLEAERVVRIMAQAADAMDYAHRNNIIHRDLKPDNIMLDNEHTEDFVKILDFGIAKSVDEAVNLSQSLTRPGTVVGSPLYMSPEQCLGQKLDATTDIYSLGVIMYEILTGTIPCKGATIYETICKKTTEPPPPFPPQFSEFRELEALTLSCLATLKTDRPGSMAEVRDRLRAMSSTTLDIPSSITVSTSAVVEPLMAEPIGATASPAVAQTTEEMMAPTAPLKLVEDVTVFDVAKLADTKRPTFVPSMSKLSSLKLISVFLGFALVAISSLYAVFHQGSISTVSGNSSNADSPKPSAQAPPDMAQKRPSSVLPRSAVDVSTKSPLTKVEEIPSAVSQRAAADVKVVTPAEKPKGVTTRAPARKAKPAPKTARVKRSRSETRKADKPARLSKFTRPIGRIFRKIRNGDF